MEYYYDAVETLKGMISRPSFSRQEKEVADYLQKRWSKTGLKLHRKGNNLWLFSPEFDPQKPTILLNSHIDTVKPVSGWRRDPFTPEETEEDCLYGLGSNDAGASVVSLFATFNKLIRKSQPYNLIFLASAEEEVSGKEGLECVVGDLPKIDLAIVGEPTEMQPAIAEKGLMVLDCVAIGKSGHAAREEGVNAITEAMKDIEWFHSYQFPEMSVFSGPVKMSVTMIQAGTQHNVVPDKCEYTVDVRSNEFYSNEQIYEFVKKHVKSIVTPRSFRLNSSHTSMDHPLVVRSLMMGKRPFGSPTLSDQALLSVPSVKMGPGSSSRSHAADEFIYLTEIREAIDTYYKLLDGLDITNK